MTLTPERIAEIEATIALRPNDVHVVVTELLTEMCRLARLGLRVEGAPVGILEGTSATGEAIYVSTIIRPIDSDCVGKRVALVVLEDSK